MKTFFVRLTRWEAVTLCVTDEEKANFITLFHFTQLYRRQKRTALAVLFCYSLQHNAAIT